MPKFQPQVDIIYLLCLVPLISSSHFSQDSQKKGTGLTHADLAEASHAVICPGLHVLANSLKASTVEEVGL